MPNTPGYERKHSFHKRTSKTCGKRVSATLKKAFQGSRKTAITARTNHSRPGIEMRVYGYATASFYTYLILIQAQPQTYFTTTRDPLGIHYDVQRQKPDTTTPSYTRKAQIYSKSSGKFVQISKRTVNATGLAESNAAVLVIETLTFGKVRIKHYQSNYYICMNAKGDIIGLTEKKGKTMKRCIFIENSREDGFTQFISYKYSKKGAGQRYLAFRQGGEPKPYTKIHGHNQHATKFVINNFIGKRHAKRNIRRWRLNHKYILQEKKRRKERQKKKGCLHLYLKCFHKNWKIKRRRPIQRVMAQCSRVFRRNNCRCKCRKH